MPTGATGRAWARFERAAEGVWGWLITFVIIACFGFWFVPQDLHDRNLASDLVRDGQWVTATDVQVHVGWVSARYGGWYEVDGVRAHLPGSAAATELEAVTGPDNDLPDESHEGWQQPTPSTGYAPPLRVRVKFDGDGTVLHAMAATDLDHWIVDNEDPETGLVIGLAGLLLAGAALGGNIIRVNRNDRRSTSGYLVRPRRRRRDPRARALARRGRR